MRLLSDASPCEKTAAACGGCYLHGRCGGLDRDGTLFEDESCFDRYCCRKSACQLVCPHNGHWVSDMNALGGLRFASLPQLRQPPVGLPVYVPLIDHRHYLRDLIDWPVVALKLSQVFRLRGREYEPVAADAAGLRTHFRLAPDTRIVLRGTDDDPHLERYWQHRQASRGPERLAALGVDAVVGPNFSHPADVVRPETLANRMRQLICLAELQAAGVTAVPHLNAAQSADWAFWERFLRDQPGITVVAKEFQTGDKDSEEGRRTIERIAAVRAAVGRPLHLVAIGAAQFAGYLAARIGTFTVLDSVPFMRTVSGGRVFDADAAADLCEPRWRKRVDADPPIDDLIPTNLRGYAEWVARAARRGRGNRIALT